MRSRSQDVDGTVRFSGGFTGQGVATGTTLIPYTVQRTAAGQYTIHYDPALTTLSVQCNHDGGGAGVVHNVAPGTFAVTTPTSGGAVVDSNGWFTVIARRMRT